MVDVVDVAWRRIRGDTRRTAGELHQERRRPARHGNDQCGLGDVTQRVQRPAGAPRPGRRRLRAGARRRRRRKFRRHVDRSETLATRVT